VFKPGSSQDTYDLGIPERERVKMEEIKMMSAGVFKIILKPHINRNRREFVIKVPIQ